MNQVKRYLGIVWIVLAPVILYLLISNAVQHIDTTKSDQVSNPVIWIIIISIFTPIVVGLLIFGWYAVKGEYDHLPESSDDFDNQ